MGDHCPSCGASSIEPFDNGLIWCTRCAQILYHSELVGRFKAWITRHFHIEWSYES